MTMTRTMAIRSPPLLSSLLLLFHCITPTTSAHANDGSNSFGATSNPTVAGSADQVFFTIQFGFEEGNDRQPTQKEVEELLCVTNPFVASYVEEYTSNVFNDARPVQLFATNIGWNYHPGDTWPIEVTFTADATYAISTDSLVVVSKETVFSGFELTVEQVITYIMDWVWKVEDSSSIFKKVVKVHFNLKKDKEVTSDLVKLEEATCAETRVPTIAPLPPSAAPSPIDLEEYDRDMDKAPTTASTTQPGQDTDPADARGSTLEVETEVEPRGDGSNDDPNQTNADGDLFENGFDPDSNTLPINVHYLVSNLEGITDPNAIIQTWGLARSWPVLVKDLVNQLPPQLLEPEPQAEPSVELKQGSPKVLSAAPVDCRPYAHPDSICHQVTSQYKLTLLDWDASHAAALGKVEMKRHYQVQTYQAVNDGRYYGILKKQVPNSPLYIGTISMNDGMRDATDHNNHESWFLALLIWLAVLCCCVLMYIAHRCWNQYQHRHKQKRNSNPSQTYLSTWEDDDDRPWKDDRDEENLALARVDSEYRREKIRQQKTVRQHYQAKRLHHALTASTA